MLKKVAIGLILTILLVLPPANPAGAEEPEEGYALLWSYETGDLVFDVSVSADGSFIAAASGDMRVYFFNRMRRGRRDDLSNRLICRLCETELRIQCNFCGGE